MRDDSTHRGRLALALLAIAACRASDAAEATPARSAAPAPAPALAPFRVELPAPITGQPTATFAPGFADPEGRARVIEARAGGAPTDRPLAIRADATALQRLRVDGTDVLLHVAPGAELGLMGHPCFGWALVAPTLDEAGRAVAPDARGTCPAGTLAAAADYRCPIDARRGDTCCYQAATLVDASGQIALEDAAPAPLAWTAAHTRDVIAGGCGFTVAHTATDRVALAIGFGQTWRLDVDPNGHITGALVAERPAIGRP
ncbi:MAG: hypothetical protein K8W52_39340 [Deltaproteobacteria bacterium]|nr:hypothetical protein [Deltaproteobacteria bacterium]